MKRIALVLAALSLTAAAHAVEAGRAPRSRAQFCALATNPENFRVLAEDPRNHMAFSNRGGLFSRGVCWWHSLYQRAAWYLTVYRPDLPKPTPEKAKFLVHQIARGKEVVEIPGYDNFFDFSLDHEKQIQAKLEQWQIVDGLLKFAWLNGILAPVRLPPHELRKRMATLADKVNSAHGIQWVMWQLPGVASHSTLFLRTRIDPAGSTSDVIDGNFPGSTGSLRYDDGTSQIQTYFGPAVLHPGRSRDLRKFAKARAVYCAQGALAHTSADEQRILAEQLDNDWD